VSLTRGAFPNQQGQRVAEQVVAHRAGISELLDGKPVRQAGDGERKLVGGDR
jgi:hypothetical protein